jgi:hypothetical protein
MEGDETEGSWRFWMKEDGKDHEREEDGIMFT